MVAAPSYSGQLRSLSISCLLEDGDLYFTASATTSAGGSFVFGGTVDGVPTGGSASFSGSSIELDEMGGQDLSETSTAGALAIDLSASPAHLTFDNLAFGTRTINGSATCSVTRGTTGTTGTTGSSTTSSIAAGGGQNLSGDDYFPLVVGAVWKYDVTSGPQAGAVYTTTVLGAHPSAAGLVVDVRYSSSRSTSTISAQYTVEANGSIEVQAGVSGSGTDMSFGGGGSYYVPDQAGVISCAPCSFSGNFTAAVPGLPSAVQVKLDETVVSGGATSVTVPAGTYPVQVLSVQITATGGAQGIDTTESSSYDLYLAKNVGIVEIGGGRGAVTVEGQTVNAPIGDEVLVSYTP